MVVRSLGRTGCRHTLVSDRAARVTFRLRRVLTAAQPGWGAKVKWQSWRRSAGGLAGIVFAAPDVVGVLLASGQPDTMTRSNIPPRTGRVRMAQVLRGQWSSDRHPDRRVCSDRRACSPCLVFASLLVDRLASDGASSTTTRLVFGGRGALRRGHARRRRCARMDPGAKAFGDSPLPVGRSPTWAANSDSPCCSWVARRPRLLLVSAGWGRDPQRHLADMVGLGRSGHRGAAVLRRCLLPADDVAGALGARHQHRPCCAAGGPRTATDDGADHLSPRPTSGDTPGRCRWSRIAWFTWSSGRGERGGSEMCTSFRLGTNDGGVVVGRTMEFPDLMGAKITAVPRGLHRPGIAPR